MALHNDLLAPFENAALPGKADEEAIRRLEALELTYKAKEAEAFLERVEEVHETIQGLIDGSIDAAELERQEEREKWRERAKQINKEEEAARAREALLMGREGKGENKKRPYTFFCRACLVEFTLPSMTQCTRCGRPVLSREARLAQLEEKVELFKEEKAKHLTRKARWKQWLNTRKFVRKTKVIHYQTWEMWEPSTDEDEKGNASAITPSDDPAFQALEKDLHANQKQRQDRRSAALRCKERGNLLLKKGDLLGALDAYEEGLEHRRDLKELWTNKALVLLKLRKYEEVCQAVTTLLEYCKIFEDGYEKSAPICFKALCRRALACRAMYRWEEALSDMRRAVSLCPGDREARNLLRETELHVRQCNDLYTILDEKDHKRAEAVHPTVDPSEHPASPSCTPTRSSSTSGSSRSSPPPGYTDHYDKQEPSSKVGSMPAASEGPQQTFLHRTGDDDEEKLKNEQADGPPCAYAERDGTRDAEGDFQEQCIAAESKNSGSGHTANTVDDATLQVPVDDNLNTTGYEVVEPPVTANPDCVSTPAPSAKVLVTSSLRPVPQNETACSGSPLKRGKENRGFFSLTDARHIPSSSSSSSSFALRLSPGSSSSSLPKDAPSASVEETRSSLCRLNESVGQVLRTNHTFSSISDPLVQEALSVLQKCPAARMWFWCYPLSLSPPACKEPVEHVQSSTSKINEEGQGDNREEGGDNRAGRKGDNTVGKEGVDTGAGERPVSRNSEGERQAHVEVKNAKKGQKETQDGLLKQKTPKDLAIEDICVAAKQMRRLKREQEEGLRNCGGDKISRTRPENEFISQTIDTLTRCSNAFRCLYCVCSFAASEDACGSQTASEDHCEAFAGTSDLSALREEAAVLSLSETCDASAAALLSLFPDIMAGEAFSPSIRAFAASDELPKSARDANSKAPGTPTTGRDTEETRSEKETKLREMKSLLLGLLHLFSLQSSSRRKLVEHLQRRRELDSFLLTLLSLMHEESCEKTSPWGSSFSPPLLPSENDSHKVSRPALQHARQARKEAGSLFCNLLLERSVRDALSGRASSVSCGENASKTARSTSVKKAGEKKQQEKERKDAYQDETWETFQMMWQIVVSRVAALKRRCAVLAKLNERLSGACSSGETEETGRERGKRLSQEFALLLKDLTAFEGRANNGETCLTHARRKVERILSTTKQGAGKAKVTEQEREESEAVLEFFLELLHEANGETPLGHLRGIISQAAETEREDSAAVDVQQCISILTNLSRCSTLRILILRNLHETLLQLVPLLHANSLSPSSCPDSLSSVASLSCSSLLFSVGKLPTAEFLGLLVNLTSSSAGVEARHETEIARCQSEFLRDERLVSFLLACLPGERKEAQRRRRGDQEAELVTIRSLTLMCRMVVALATTEANQIHTPNRVHGICSPPLSPRSCSSNAPDSSLRSSLSPSRVSPCLSVEEVTRSLLPSLGDLLGRWQKNAVKRKREFEAKQDACTIDQKTSTAVQLLCVLTQRTPFLATVARAEAACRRAESGFENREERGERSGTDCTEEKSEEEKEEGRGGEEKAQRLCGEEKDRSGQRAAMGEQQGDKETERITDGKTTDMLQAYRREEARKAHMAHNTFGLTNLVQWVCEILKAATPKGYAKDAEEMKTPTALVRGNLLLFLGLAAKAQLAAISRNVQREGDKPRRRETVNITGRVETAEKTTTTGGNTYDAKERTEREDDDKEGSDRVLEDMDLSAGIFCCIEALRKDVSGPQRNAAVTLAALAQITKYKPAIIALNGMESLMQIAGPLLLKNH
uniref:Tetratricopeptide repeat-containing protein n=1 Tax=Toxoplasma gondii COUG TaxID=1074873 RepID=A0A2G8XQS3_TOXGO|nr:tetratricopeptide repeat-containing protein [Toxoplasma gondii COUG]